MALRGLTFQLHPRGGKRRESNLLPHRDCGYGAATAPAVLTGASQRDILTSVAKSAFALRATARRPSRLAALACRAVAPQGAKAGGELRVRTSVLADPSVFGTDCRPLQRRSPCISQDSNLDPVRYERTALPIELEMPKSARQDSNLRSPAPEAGAFAGLSYALISDAIWRSVGKSNPSRRVDGAAASPEA